MKSSTKCLDEDDIQLSLLIKKCKKIVNAFYKDKSDAEKFVKSV